MDHSSFSVSNLQRSPRFVLRIDFCFGWIRGRGRLVVVAVEVKIVGLMILIWGWVGVGCGVWW